MMECVDAAESGERYLEVILKLLHERTPDDHTRIAMTYSKLAALRERRGDVEGQKKHGSWAVHGGGPNPKSSRSEQHGLT
jgi:hypothetical protein